MGILQILNGAHVAGAVSCLAQLGIPDLLKSGPKTAEELANQIGAQPDALYRLRPVIVVGVLLYWLGKRKCGPGSSSVNATIGTGVPPRVH